jgi:hypothetical protein
MMTFLGPVMRALALVHLADTLAAKERDRKLALLDRALLQARAATEEGDRLLRMGEVAERWFELGEVDKARGLFAEGLKVAQQLADKTDSRRGRFAASLALVDVPAALAIGKEFDDGELWGDIALRLVDHNAAEAERVWNLTKGKGRRLFTDPNLAWSLFDPLAAVARLEKLPIDPKLDHNAIRARLVVAESLAQYHEQRWRKIWQDWHTVFGVKRDF